MRRRQRFASLRTHGHAAAAWVAARMGRRCNAVAAAQRQAGTTHVVMFTCAGAFRH